MREVHLNGHRFSLSIATVAMLVVLRIAIGWHFFSQGVDHYRDPKWSSEGFLSQAKGPFADFYRSQVPDFHRFNELVARPWQDATSKQNEAGKMKDAGQPNKPAPLKAAQHNKTAFPASAVAAMRPALLNRGRQLALADGDDDKSKAKADAQPSDVKSEANPVQADLKASTETKPPTDAKDPDAKDPDTKAPSAKQPAAVKTAALNTPNEGNPRPIDEPQPAPGTGDKTTSDKTKSDAAGKAAPNEGAPDAAAAKRLQESAAKNKADLEKSVATAEAHPVYGEFVKQVLKDWNERAREIVTYYGYDKDQQQTVDAYFDIYRGSLVTYLTDRDDDLFLYQKELRRLKDMESFQGASQIPFASKRTTEKQREVLNKPKAWVEELRRMESGFATDLNTIATPEQLKQGWYVTPDSSLRRSDRIITWMLMICGGLLIVGLFTRISAVLCAAFLIMVMLSQPPWIEGTVTMLFPYQLVEALALLTLATTAVGRWGGLDFFVHFLISAPFRSAKR